MNLTSPEIFNNIEYKEHENEIIKAIEEKFSNLDFTQIDTNKICLRINNNNYNDLTLKNVIKNYMKNANWKAVKYKYSSIRNNDYSIMIKFYY